MHHQHPIRLRSGGRRWPPPTWNRTGTCRTTEAHRCTVHRLAERPATGPTEEISTASPPITWQLMDGSCLQKSIWDTVNVMEIKFYLWSAAWRRVQKFNHQNWKTNYQNGLKYVLWYLSTFIWGILYRAQWSAVASPHLKIVIILYVSSSMRMLVL